MPQHRETITTNAADATVRIPRVPAPNLSIVIVTFGTGPVILDALRAITTNTDFGLTPVEVIVVDNFDGTGGTAEMLRSRTDGVRLVCMDQNVGFGPANDIGVSVARGRFVCLCNPDVMVTEGWAEPLLAALHDSVVGIAAPPLLHPDGTLQEAGQLLYDDGCTAAIGGPEVLTGDTAQLFTRDVDYASAACWMLRRDEYLGFNPRLVPAYFEDVDYALRMEQRGQVTRLVVDRPVVHLHGSSTGAAGAASAIAERSREIFRAEWRQRIATQPSRPTCDGDAILSRDRACERRIAMVAASTRQNARVATEALRLAVNEPRWRVSLFAENPPHPDALQRAGVEVCDDDPSLMLARRPGWATEITLAPAVLDHRIRTAIERTQPGVNVTRLRRGSR